MKNHSRILVILCLMIVQVVHAQDQNMSPAGVMISHCHPKGGFMLTYMYMNMNMGGNISGNTLISDNAVYAANYTMSAQRMQMNMHMLMGMYGLTGRLTVMAMAEYDNKQMHMKAYSAMHMHGGSMEMNTSSTDHDHCTAGLGDTKVWALYKLYNGQASNIVASLGVSIPTGSIRYELGEHANFPGEHQSYMMQTGSGSVDLLPGVTYIKDKYKYSYSFQLSSIIRPFYNSLNYHSGNEVSLNSWISWKPLSWISGSLRAEGWYGESISGKDQRIYIYSEPGSNPVNYGGKRVNAYAGINFYILKGWFHNIKAGIEGGMPFYEGLNGIQQTTQSTFITSITKSF